MQPEHLTVQLKEAVDALHIHPDGIYLDATFGRGGHSREILSRLSPSGQLWVFDQDLEAIAVARAWALEDARLHVVHTSFARVKEVCEREGIQGFDGVLCDLGVSSPQLDQGIRGFSFMRDGPLDMRMDQTRGQTAAEWLAEVDEGTLVRVLWEYGEERFARRIAHKIVELRQTQPIRTTRQLAACIESAKPFRDPKKHAATQSFQAIRIHINRELESLEQFLGAIPTCLNGHASLVMMSFHSLEDRCVKTTFKRWVEGVSMGVKELPLQILEASAFRWGVKQLKATDLEREQNPRARSVVLRSVVKKAE